jgi:hypothetical protein
MNAVDSAKKGSVYSTKFNKNGKMCNGCTDENTNDSSTPRSHLAAANAGKLPKLIRSDDNKPTKATIFDTIKVLKLGKLKSA